MLADRRRIGEEAVKCDQGGDTRKNRQQSIEGNARCYRDDAVVRDVLIDPPKNTLPIRRKYQRGGGCPAPFLNSTPGRRRISYARRASVRDFHVDAVLGALRDLARRSSCSSS